MPRPLLSIGMIVKNEARCLEKSLQALRPLREAVPCELVIADTGSEDETREIAAKYADILFDFVWTKDFSAARNAVMDRCSGAWYLSLDADEYLDPDIKELSAFLQSDMGRECTSAFLVINNYSNPDDESQYSMFHAQRLLNMSTHMRFQGIIHESWPDLSLQKHVFLENTVLWHDGYISNGNLTEKNKGRRNMELLEAALKQEPDSLLRVLQAAESSYRPEQAIRYARHMIELVERGVEKADILGPTAFRDGIKIALDQRLPEFQLWLEEALERYPDSLYIQVDVCYMAVTEAQERHDYGTVLKYGAIYAQGIERIARKDTGRYGLRMGTIIAGAKVHQEGIAIIMAMAHARRREWTECLELLKQYPPDTLSPANVSRWLNVAYFSWEYIDLSDLFEHLGQCFYQTELEDPQMKARRDAFAARTATMFFYVPPNELEPDEFYPEAPAFPLLAAMGECDLSLGARLMMEEDRESAKRLADRIRDWSGLPIVVVVKMLSLKLPLPKAFYGQTPEYLEDLAGRLAAHLGASLSANILEWDACHGSPGSLIEQMWRYNLTIGALKAADWRGEREQLLELLALYAEKTEEFLVRYYHPSLLQESNIVVLPGMHRFGWMYLRAREKREAGDQTGYVRWLRRAVETAPAAKEVVNFLLEELEQGRSDRSKALELQSLAEQIRAVLSRYGPDDPVVAEIKGSAAYQAVSDLIEGRAAAVFGGLVQ